MTPDSTSGPSSHAPADARTGRPTDSLDIGVVGNCQVAALVDAWATVNWFCFPRLDADPAFCSLIGGDRLLNEAGDGAGGFTISLEQGTPRTQGYIANTPALVTEIAGPGGAIRVTDFAPRFNEHGRIFRPAMLVRIVEPIEGAPRITVCIRPRRSSGGEEPESTQGSHHIRYLLDEANARVTTDAPVDFVKGSIPFVLRKPVVFVFGIDEPLLRPPADVARELLERTVSYWREWTRSLSVPFEWQDVVIRAAITLKLCAYEETGGIVAALTTSIPEYGQGARNWDYRFCWLRDAFFTVQTLNRLGATRTLEDYIGYIGNIAAGSRDGYLQPLFGLRHETGIVEHEAPALGGYRNMNPVRFGNAAYTQVQNDAYGSVILALSQSFFDARMLVQSGIETFRQLEALGEQALQRWNQPDAGVWEFRTRAEVHTHSAVMCWAACDRLARIAARLGLPQEHERWRQAALRVREGILAKAWNAELGSFVATFGGDAVDASLLLLPDVGIVAYDDPHFVATLARIEKDLRVGGHVMRYATTDDFGSPESAFTICTLWYIECLARIGRKDEARELFAGVLATRNPLGLLSEGFHVGTNELWGNFPQTYSMVGLIRCAMRLSTSWDDAF